MQRVESRTGFARVLQLVLNIIPLAAFLVVGVELTDVPEPISASHLLLASIVSVIGLGLVCYTLRGPERHYSWPNTIIACLEFAAYAFLITLLMLALLFQTMYSPTAILEATLVGVASASIVVATGVTWLYTWPFAEPLAIGIVSITLGGLCWPGLYPLIQPVTYPPVPGAALVFAGGPARPQLSLAVQTDPDNFLSQPTGESFRIRNTGSGPEHWALLLIAGARLTDPVSSSGYKMWTRSFTTEFSPPSGLIQGYDQRYLFGMVVNNLYTGVGQLVSGTLNGNSSIVIQGKSLGQFFASAGGRSAVSLPFYGQGQLAYLDDNTANIVAKAMGTAPSVIPPSGFAVTVDSGKLLPIESLTSSQPVLAASSAASSTLAWASHSMIAIYYETLNQYKANIASDVLFIFAVLLGVAGAGIITSLQAVIHTLLSRPAASKV